MFQNNCTVSRIKTFEISFSVFLKKLDNERNEIVEHLELSAHDEKGMNRIRGLSLLLGDLLIDGGELKLECFLKREQSLGQDELLPCSVDPNDLSNFYRSISKSTPQH